MTSTIPIESSAQQQSVVIRVAPFCAVLWLLYVMNTVFAWIPFHVILRLIGVSGVFAASLLMKNREVTNLRIRIAFLVFCYFLWTVVKMEHAVAYISVAIDFSPLMCILFWPANMLKDIYTIFRKIVIFFAIGSTIITLLYYVGQLSHIPHFELPSQSSLHENHQDYYNVYIIFPELIAPGSFTRRACGMMEEPGHFGIVLGYVYLIDRYTHRRIHPAIFVCAILTFSSTFFLILFFTEIWNFIRYWKKTLLYTVSAAILAVVVFQALPRDMQDVVKFLAFERNMEQVTETFENSGSLTEALDERSNDLGNLVYDRMSFSKKIVGGEWDGDIVLSDYRGFIVTHGLIGIVIIILVSLASLHGATFQLKMSLFLTMFLIMLHRAWFFYEPFPYFMAFIACSLQKTTLQQSCLSH